MWVLKLHAVKHCYYVGAIGSWWFSSLHLESIGVNPPLDLPNLGVEQRSRDSCYCHVVYTQERGLVNLGY